MSVKFLLQFWIYRNRMRGFHSTIQLYYQPATNDLVDTPDEINSVTMWYVPTQVNQEALKVHHQNNNYPYIPCNQAQHKELEAAC